MSSEAAVAPRRLHPAGIAVLGIGALRDLALPLGIAFASMVLGGGGGQPLLRAVGFGAIGVVAAIGLGYARWATTRWSIGEGTIRLRTGVLSERETDVPLGRVQAIDTVHGPVQRLFGIRGVHVQTAGGGKAGEITLPALTAADVELLRRAVRGGAVLETAPAPLAERRLSRRRLLLAALTAGQLGVILPLLAALPQLAEELWGGDLARAGREGVGLVPDSAVEWALAAAALLAAAWLLSTAGAVVAFAGFTVARDEGDRIRIRRGLLAHREATVPVARVQAVRIVEGLLRQPFGLVTLRVEVAGYAKEAAAAQTLFPLLRRAEVAPFLAALLPEAGGEAGVLVGTDLCRYGSFSSGSAAACTRTMAPLTA
jgi:putative membrane protein